MRIIFIRHGDPNYELDTLTDKGIREASLLAKRVSEWDVKEFYCSPLGRAKKTASFSLEKMHRDAITYDWLKEFNYPITDPTTSTVHVPWDFMPEYWTGINEYYDKDKWIDTELYQSNQELSNAYLDVCKGLDDVISQYGYKRFQNYYKVEKHSDDTIVFFCHLGVTCVMLSHLLGISPVVLWHDFYLAPTSVTILGSEERYNNGAAFRVQVMGDTSHLMNGGEPISQAGYFTTPFHK